MKLFFAFALLFNTALSVGAALPPDLGKLSVGTNNTCAIDAEGVKCWGSHENGLLKVPVLNEPFFVSVGSTAACAIDLDGVKCWGGMHWTVDDRYHELKVPPLQNPRMVSVSVDHYICALDDNGVKCWASGREENYASKPTEPLKEASALSTGSEPCAVTPQGVRCWGNAYAQSLVPSFSNPFMTAGSWYHSCAINDEGVACWMTYPGVFERRDTVMLDRPKLSHPKAISMGFDNACAIDDRGVICWGQNEHGVNDVPKLNHPRFVSAGWNHTCAIDDDGIHCWGSNEFGQNDVPPLVSTISDGSSLTRFLESLTKILYLSRRPLYDAVLKYVRNVPETEETTLAFVANVLQPDLATIDSDVLAHTMLPRWDKARASLNKKIGIHALSDLAPSAHVLEISSLLVREILQASKDHFAEAGDRLAELGKLEAEGKAKDPRGLRELLERMGTLREALLAEPRLKGYGLVLRELEEYARTAPETTERRQ